MAIAVEHQEALTFIESHALMGKGLGYVDVHLLASCILTELPIWTLDKKLARVADMLHCRHQLQANNDQLHLTRRLSGLSVGVFSHPSSRRRAGAHTLGIRRI